MIQIYIQYPDKKIAKKISKVLLDEKLAACVDLFEHENMYWWQGEMKNEKGIACLVATRKDNYAKIEKVVTRLHPDEVPCILEWPVGNVFTPYKEWLYEETK